MVEAMLVPQRYIEDSYECDDAMQKLIKEKEKIVKMSSNQIYLIRHKGAIFKRMQVVDLEQGSSERESDMGLYSVVFYTTLADKILWVRYYLLLLKNNVFFITFCILFSNKHFG
jgi:hypothetical protein